MKNMVEAKLYSIENPDQYFIDIKKTRIVDYLKHQKDR